MTLQDLLELNVLDQEKLHEHFQSHGNTHFVDFSKCTVGVKRVFTLLTVLEEETKDFSFFLKLPIINAHILESRAEGRYRNDIGTCHPQIVWDRIHFVETHEVRFWGKRKDALMAYFYEIKPSIVRDYRSCDVTCRGKQMKDWLHKIPGIVEIPHLYLTFGAVNAWRFLYDTYDEPFLARTSLKVDNIYYDAVMPKEGFDMHFSNFC